MVEVESDFTTDWTNVLRQRLVQIGYPADPNAAMQEVWIRYFTAEERLIGARPRRVLRSKEFRCPASVASGLDRLLKKMRRGGYLAPHLSRTILDCDYSDKLLFDWDIHHFHLGIRSYAKDPRFVDRTDHVLLARVTDDIIYCIDVRPHQENGLPTWVNQELINILHDNWPQSLAPYELNGVLPGDRHTDREVHTLRKKNANTVFTSRSGTVYMSPGGGVTCAGTSVQATLNSIAAGRQVEAVENWAKENADHLRELLLERGFAVGERLKLMLEESPNGFLVHETQTAMRFQVPMPV